MESRNTTHNATSPAASWTEEEKRVCLEQLNHDLFLTLLPTVVFLLALIAVGLPANLLVFLVYMKQFPPSSTRVFILALAACDLLISTFTLPHLVVTMHFTYSSLGLNYCRTMKVLSTCPILMSYWLLVCVALDRRRRICHPLTRHLTSHQVMRLLAVSCSLTFLIMVAFIPFYVEKRLDTDVAGLSGSTCEPPSVHVGGRVTKISSCVFMIAFLLGFSATAVSYLQIFWQLYQQKKKIGQRQGFFGSEERAKDSHRQVPPHFQHERNANILDSNARFDFQSECESTALVFLEEPSGATVCTKTLGRGVDRHAQIEETEISKRDDLHVSNLPSCHPELTDNPDTGNKIGNTNISKCDWEQEMKGQQEARASQLLEIVDLPARDDRPGRALEEDGDKQSPRADRATPRPAKRVRRARVDLGRTTLIMFVTSVSAIVCCVPYFVMELAEVEFGKKELSPAMVNLYFLSHFFPCLNNVINPVIYGFFNPKFRLECRRLLMLVRKRLF